MSLLCPRCAAGLETHEADPHFHVGLCNGCGGIWLGVEAHRTVEAALSVAASEAQTRQSKFEAVHPAPDPELPCPECSEKMSRFHFGDINIDHCDAHGTWYDSRELDEVASVLRARGAQIARATEVPTAEDSEVPTYPRGGEQPDEVPEDAELKEKLVQAPSNWEHVGEVSAPLHAVLSTMTREPR